MSVWRGSHRRVRPCAGKKLCLANKPSINLLRVWVCQFLEREISLSHITLPDSHRGLTLSLYTRRLVFHLAHWLTYFCTVHSQNIPSALPLNLQITYMEEALIKMAVSVHMFNSSIRLWAKWRQGFPYWTVTMMLSIVTAALWVLKNVLKKFYMLRKSWRSLGFKAT